MKTVTIHLPDEVAHRLEVRAAIDDITLTDGITALLIDLVERFEGRE